MFTDYVVLSMKKYIYHTIPYHTIPYHVIVTSPRGERLPAQVADHLSDAADVMPVITGASGCSALDDIELVNVFFRVSVGPIP